MFITILLPAGRRNPSSRQPWVRVISECFFLPIGLDGDPLLIDEERSSYLYAMKRQNRSPFCVVYPERVMRVLDGTHIPPYYSTRHLRMACAQSLIEPYAHFVSPLSPTPRLFICPSCFSFSLACGGMCSGIDIRASAFRLDCERIFREKSGFF